jgi:DNA-binding transcriptional regulator/RsmH inhibitor MraZ
VTVVGIINKMEIWAKTAWDERRSVNGDKVGDVLSSLGL